MYAVLELKILSLLTETSINTFIWHFCQLHILELACWWEHIILPSDSLPHQSTIVCNPLSSKSMDMYT